MEPGLSLGRSLLPLFPAPNGALSRVNLLDDGLEIVAPPRYVDVGCTEEAMSDAQTNGIGYHLETSNL